MFEFQEGDDRKSGDLLEGWEGRNQLPPPLSDGEEYTAQADTDSETGLVHFKVFSCHN